jgi:hypothetical protein
MILGFYKRYLVQDLDLFSVKISKEISRIFNLIKNIASNWDVCTIFFDKKSAQFFLK